MVTVCLTGRDRRSALQSAWPQFYTPPAQHRSSPVFPPYLQMGRGISCVFLWEVLGPYLVVLGALLSPALRGHSWQG